MDELSAYLNGHVAASGAALEFLDRLVETYKGKPLEHFFSDLRADIDQDQEQLKQLIEKLGIQESAVRKAGAWIAEKFSRPKIDLSEGSKPEIGLFLALEALILGITGKRSLWRALEAAARTRPELARLDYSGLEKLAIEHGEPEEERA